MELLLDTNTLLWALGDPARLRQAVRDALTDPRNRVYVSAICAWEIAIKVALGKLHAPRNVGSWLPTKLEESRFTPLSITVEHAVQVEYLPRHHGDPFDRLLIAQAQVEGLTIVTADDVFERYDVGVMRC